MPESESSICQRVEGEVLRQCYERIYIDGPDVTSVTVSESTGVALDDVYAIREGMVGKRLINRQAYFGVDECSLWITPRGLREAEARRVIDPTLAREHRRVCELILRHLSKVRTERGWHYPWHPVEDDGIDIPSRTLKLVLPILEEDGLINSVPNPRGDGLPALFPSRDGPYQIAPAGIDQLHAWDDETSPARELAQIEKLAPQRRGKALEGVIAEALRRQGCHCISEAGGTGEQIDLVIECGSGFYVCEAKWLKERVQPAVVDQMKGRLDRRPAVVVGVIFSMSDFTSAARSLAIRHATQRTILLLGEDDTRAVIRGERGFEEIVRCQLRNLVARDSL